MAHKGVCHALSDSVLSSLKSAGDRVLFTQAIKVEDLSMVPLPAQNQPVLLQ